MSTDLLVELFPALKWWAIVSTTVVAVIVGVLLGLGSAYGLFIKVKLLLSSLKSKVLMGNKKQKWKTNGTV